MAFAKQEIDKAIRNNEFVPYFQPIVELRSGVLEGFEILARWHHPTRGLISPLDFIPVVERFELMNDLTDCLLTQAFRSASIVPNTICFSANISPSQLHDRKLPSLMARIASETGFDLRRLTGELTESALLDDLTLAASVAGSLKALGMRLSLDDFGTGYSSLLHLQALPFDEIKIDSSFVRSMATSRDGRKITAAVINLGQSLGLRTVGEGVEDYEQAELLTGQGCELGQGYLFGRPVPADQLAAIIAKPTLGGDLGKFASEKRNVDRGLEAHSSDRLSQIRAIYDGAPVGLCFLDRSLRLVNLNQFVADLNGLPIKAHLGRTVSEMYPALYPIAERYLLCALEGEATLGVEIESPAAFPGVPGRSIIASFQPAHDETGEVIGVSVSLVDVTIFKRTESDLRKALEHYKNTADLSPHIPWMANAAGKVLSISASWQRFTGLSLEQSAGDGWLSPVDPGDIDNARQRWAYSIETGTPMDIEFVIRGADGLRHHMRTRANPYHDIAGNIANWYGSVECIDDQKQMIESLSYNEATLRSVFNAAPAGLVLVESETGSVTHANPRAQALLGCDLPVGMVWTDVPWKLFDTKGSPMSPSDLPLARALSSGESNSAIELMICRPDNTVVWISATASPVLSEDGLLIGGVLAMMDLDASRSRQFDPTPPPGFSRTESGIHEIPNPKRFA